MAWKIIKYKKLEGALSRFTAKWQSKGQKKAVVICRGNFAQQRCWYRENCSTYIIFLSIPCSPPPPWCRGAVARCASSCPAPSWTSCRRSSTASKWRTNQNSYSLNFWELIQQKWMHMNIQELTNVLIL